jgi:4-alpha-glucanotransferase
MSLYDVLRIDHFRAFADYWEITAESETALNGHWVTGPGVQFFDAIKRQLGPLPLIAEDLGILSAAAIQLRDQLKIPGLRILLFAFDTDDPHSPFLPQNFIENCVAYTGTHDNNTATGAFDSANVDANGISVGRRRRQILRKYLPKEYEFLPLHEGLLRWLCGSAAQWIIYPMQDVLALGREARLNTPGVPLGNWEWKLCTEQLEGKVRFFLQQLAKREGV